MFACEINSAAVSVMSESSSKLALPYRQKLRAKYHKVSGDKSVLVSLSLGNHFQPKRQLLQIIRAKPICAKAALRTFSYSLCMDLYVHDSLFVTNDTRNGHTAA